MTKKKNKQTTPDPNAQTTQTAGEYIEMNDNLEEEETHKKTVLKT
jgi:hypothetical protein